LGGKRERGRRLTGSLYIVRSSPTPFSITGIELVSEGNGQSGQVRVLKDKRRREGKSITRGEEFLRGDRCRNPTRAYTALPRLEQFLQRKHFD
jgi:hypothetical protein